MSDCVAWRSPVKPNQAAMQCNTNCISVSLFVFGFDEWYNCEIGPNLSCNARHSAKGINIVNLPWDVGKCIGSKSSHRSFIAFIAFFSKLCCRKEKACVFANLLNWSGKPLPVCNICFFTLSLSPRSYLAHKYTNTKSIQHISQEYNRHKNTSVRSLCSHPTILQQVSSTKTPPSP